MPPTEGGKEELSGLPVEEEQAHLAKAELEERTVELQYIATSISGTPHRWQELPSLQSCVRAVDEVEAAKKLEALAHVPSQCLQSKCVPCACFGWRALANDAAVLR